MLPKNNRITESKDFLRLFKTVRPIHTAHLVIRVASRTNKTQDTRYKQDPNSNSQNSKEILKQVRDDVPPSTPYSLPSRFGFVVSNKIDKRSARRNGLKRRIRAVVENNLNNIQPGADVVVQVKQSFDYPYDYKAIEMEMLEGIKRIGILRNSK